MSFEDLHRPLSNVRGAVRWILITATVVFFLQHFWGAWMLENLGLIPVLVLHGHKVWQLFTYQFLHGGIFHWLFNMFILWMIGGMLESQWGTPYFVRFFLITGLGAALCVLLMAPHSTIPVIGLSASIFGMLVAFAMLYPHSVMYLYFVIPVKAWHAAALFAVIELFAALNGGNAAVTSIAHLGGMLFGYVYVRFGTLIDYRVGWLFSALRVWPPRSSEKSQVSLHEVTDDLVSEVDRILDKVSRKGAESLTGKEKDIMNRYTRMRH
jgi:membrane associated rhomboid family serine protease